MALVRITHVGRLKPGDIFAVSESATPDPDVRFVAVVVLPTGVMGCQVNPSSLWSDVKFVKTEHVWIETVARAEHGAWYHVKWSKGLNEAVGLPDGRLFHVEARKAIEFYPAEWNKQDGYVG